ncbi:hypothetical protein K435DRAFT_961136 [Dendrothele bispora CBS 962.96]|uniref:Rab-GAP TBC domain-containing protein n=1 Tax=Dendrothele bispora (strain CBS 962.96) TaxID=1314807 RepID=A0A4S8MQM7_DENBC|nr:hypothetical protein K435DRAFT_961136 [Dendrothele bispora CBS 962.96]
MSFKPELETKPSSFASSSPSLSSGALRQDEWKRLREKSLQVGGFGEERAELWPKLLNAHYKSQSTPETDLNLTERSNHKDERQIRLDTDRSFVLYPVGVTKDKETLQEELYQLLVEIFRRRPKLSYFQGYHDIITVIFLTLPSERQLACAEKISLHRVRDSMGSSLEPVLGLLRFMKNLIRLADPEYAEILEESVPLPYFALSNLLTLFSHDMPTLPLIQHVFDYLLSRPPIMVVYLATAITLSRKAEVQLLQDEGEVGMLHSLLTGLPNLTDGEEILTSSIKEDKGEPSTGGNEDMTLLEVAVKEEKEKEKEGISVKSTKDDKNCVPPEKEEAESDIKQENTECSPELGQSDDARSVQGGGDNDGQNPKSKKDIKNTRSRIQNEDVSEDSTDPNTDLQSTQQIPTESLTQLEQIPPPSSPSPSSSSPKLKDGSSSTSGWGDDDDDEDNLHTRKPTIPLISLLQQADTLYSSYPPTHPSLALSSIMGPQSVVFTWSENPSEMPNDDAAEAIVEHPESVVLPYVEEEEEVPDKEKEIERERRISKGTRRLRKRDKALRTLMGILQFRDKKATVASAIVMLGIAMAVYGVAHGSLGRDVRHGEHWRKISGWLGGVLLGVGDRVW